MMYYTVFATICLLGTAAAQTGLSSYSCLTKNQNLRMNCSILPESLHQTSCYIKTGDKVVATTDNSIQQDSSYKNRATIAIVGNVCHMNLTGFSDSGPTPFTCFIMHATSTTTVKIATSVDKSKLQPCSAWCVLQHSGVAFLLAFLTFPLLSELL